MGANIIEFLKSKKTKFVVFILLVVIMVIIFLAGSVYIALGKEFEVLSNLAQGFTKETTIVKSGNSNPRIKTQVTAEEVWKNLGSAQDYCTAEQLEYLMNAEIVTQYPYIDGIEEGSLNGIIKFYRDINEDGQLSEDERITYIDSTEFETKMQEYNDSGNEDIFKYFTLDEENIKVAYSTTETRTVKTNDIQVDKNTIEDYDSETDYIYNLTSSSNGQDVYTSIKYSIDEESIPYATLVSQYTMPFDLLAAILVTTENIDFTTEIAELAYNSEINIAIYNNKQIYDENQEYTYIKQSNVETTASVRIANDFGFKYPNAKYWVLNSNSNYRNILWKSNDETSTETRQAASDYNSDTFYLKSITDTGIENTSVSEEAKEFTTTYNFNKESNSIYFERMNIKTWILDATYEYSYNDVENEETNESRLTITEYVKLNQYSETFDSSNIEENESNVSVGHAQDLLNQALEEVKSNITDEYLNERLQEINEQRNAEIRDILDGNINDAILINVVNTYFRTSEFGVVLSPNNNNIITQDIKDIAASVEDYSQIENITITSSQEENMRDLISSDDEEELESEEIKNIYVGIIKSYINTNLGQEKTIDELRQEYMDNINGSIQEVLSEISIRDTSINEISVITNINKNIQQGTPVVTENTDDFVEIFNKSEYSTASQWMQDYWSWCEEYLEDSDDISDDMIDMIKYLMYEATGNESFNTDDFSFDEYYSSLNSAGTIISGDSLAETIWFTLKNYNLSDYSIAAVLGNLYGESGIRANNMENTYEIGQSNSIGYTDTTYTEAIDNGTYSRESFFSDSVGYGLAQWTSSGRKQGLYDYAESRNVSIADENMQIEFLIAEILSEGSAVGYASYQMTGTHNGYTVDDWYNPTSIETATRAFCDIFERCDPARAYYENRISAAENYYNQFKDLEVPSNTSSSTYLDIENIMSLSNLTGENKTKMQNIIQLAIDIANDDSYWYSQQYRNQTINGITYYDCSSFLKHVYGTYEITLPDRTALYDSSYDQYIVSYSPSSYVSSLQPGDVIWKGGGSVTGHVMMYLGNDYWVAARTDDPNLLTVPEQISVYDTTGWTSSYLSEYMRVYRFIQ